MYNQRETFNSWWRILFILEHDQSSYLFYDVYTLFTELIYQVKAARTLSLPHDEVHANKSSFICESIFLQKTEEGREQRKNKRRADKVQIQRKKEEREVLCRHRVVRGERGEWDAEQTGLSWRHCSWLIEWELVWQSEAGCHVTEGEQKTGEGGWRMLLKQRRCACLPFFICPVACQCTQLPSPARFPGILKDEWK